MIQTKNYYLNEAETYARSEEPLFGLGYSLDIPWLNITTAGWQHERPNIWGYENKLTVGEGKPEYYAPGNLIRSNVIPSINPNDPMYAYDRAKHTYKLF